MRDGTTEHSQQVPDNSAWGEQISEQRQLALDATLRQWQAAPPNSRKRSPFFRESLSGADVHWLAVRALAGFDGDVSTAQRQLRNALHDTEARLALNMSALHLEGTNLAQACLNHAALNRAHLEGADLSRAKLEDAALFGIHLDRANLTGAQLTSARLSFAHLDGAKLLGVSLDQAALLNASLRRANLLGATLTDADLYQAHLDEADLTASQMTGANLSGAYLIGTILHKADLQRARLTSAHCQGADLRESRCEASKLRNADMSGADLRLAYFDAETELHGAVLSSPKPGPVRIADVHWGEANLSVINWSPLHVLGDELSTSGQSTQSPRPPLTWKAARLNRLRPPSSTRRLRALEDAVRANRQLAVALQAQGLHEHADRFAYRAQSLSRKVHWEERHMARWLFAWLLCWIAGYGYRPGRTVGLYIAIIGLFSWAYYAMSPLAHVPLSLPAALVMSVSSFHGRGFFPDPNMRLDSPVVELAALEAVVGLLIEVSFIATFTQRFFGK